MTPPLPSGPLLGTSKLPPSLGPESPDSGIGIGAPPVDGTPLRPVDSYVPMDNTSDSYKTVEDLLKAIGDEQLFGTVPNAKYQPERNGKYLKVTSAILEIRKLLKQDEKNSSYAVNAVKEWLSDGTLVQDTTVAHQARVNLIKALKRAPKDAPMSDGIKSVIQALEANYSTNVAAPKETPKETPKDPPKVDAKPAAKESTSLIESFSDAKLFGAKFPSYDSERNKKYLAVTSAILEIRKFIRGDVSSAKDASAKIVAWLGDSTLLTDPVAHQGRMGLIQALGGSSKGEAKFDQGVQEMISALKADYSKAAPAKKEEAKPSPDVKSKSDGNQLTEVTVNPKSKTREQREDTASTFSNGLQGAIKPSMNRILKKANGGFSVKSKMTVTIDDNTGQILTVSFKDIKTSGDVSDSDVKELCANIADALRGRFRFKPMGESGIAVIVTPLSIVGGN